MPTTTGPAILDWVNSSWSNFVDYGETGICTSVTDLDSRVMPLTVMVDYARVPPADPISDREYEHFRRMVRPVEQCAPTVLDVRAMNEAFEIEHGV